jgi:hypothetical protein
MEPPKRTTERLTRWLLEIRTVEAAGPEAREDRPEQHPWWKVVCLTGVDYFSTLGYIPPIAALAAGALSPIAILLIVLLTLFGALPMYRRVAAESPHGQGSIAMLEDMLSFWKGKTFVLCLLGFVATAWLVTMTLSTADATAHLVKNPFVGDFVQGREVIITLLLLVVLGAVFLKGFKEAIGVAVVVVGAYLLLNLVVVAVGLYESVANPRYVTDWSEAVFTSHGNPLTMIGLLLLVFPRLALGLSGFETGVSLMPLVGGDEGDAPQRPVGCVRNTRKMLNQDSEQPGLLPGRVVSGRESFRHLGNKDRHECGSYRAEAQVLARRFVAGAVGPKLGNGPWAGGSSANSRTGSGPDHGAGQVAAHLRQNLGRGGER